MVIHGAVGLDVLPDARVDLHENLALPDEALRDGLTGVFNRKHLEERIGLQLFDRTPRGVAPTFAGHRLYRLSVGVLM